ncbi:MAG TPA: hypothetical protein VGP26_16460 [Actinophytocola sp.]|nr:hypothetical protein [Actinophytocola sp.]
MTESPSGDEQRGQDPRQTVDGLLAKLDAFTETLTPDERMLLWAILKAAEGVVAVGPDVVTSPFADEFRDAFSAGAGHASAPAAGTHVTPAMIVRNMIVRNPALATTVSVHHPLPTPPPPHDADA